MTRFVAFALASTALAGCATPAPPPAAIAETAAGEAPAPVTAPAPKPEYGTFGFDYAGMDKGVAPGNDFYGYANGTWAKNTPIPADKSNYGMFTVLDDLSRERTRQIIEEQAKDPNSRIGAAYASYMDQAAVESKGLTPFQPWLDQVRGLKSRSGLAALYAQARKLQIGTPFGGFVGQDDK